MASIDELIGRIADLRDGRLSRFEAVGWARSQGGNYGQPNPYGRSLEARIAWWALDTLKIADYETSAWDAPSEYFIRTHDLSEWMAALSGEDAPPGRRADVVPLRPQQQAAGNAQYAFSILMSPQVVGERLGFEHMRACDDLGPQMFSCFKTVEGEVTFIEWRAVQHLRDGAVSIREGRNRHEALDTIQRLLGLPASAITHIAE